MRGKKGQFYLVAAVIIVLAIVGITSVRTYAITKYEPRKINDISTELKEETSRIVEHGIYQKENLTELTEDFTESEFAPYFLKKTEGTSIVFVYGNKTDLYSVQYKPDYTGTISATIGGSGVNWNPLGVYSNKSKITDITDDKINIMVLNKTFVFDVRENEMFYFLITQEKEGEIYVERN